MILIKTVEVCESWATTKINLSYVTTVNVIKAQIVFFSVMLDSSSCSFTSISFITQQINDFNKVFFFLQLTLTNIFSLVVSLSIFCGRLVVQ